MWKCFMAITLKAFQTNITVFICVAVTLTFFKRKDPSRWSYSKIRDKYIFRQAIIIIKYWNATAMWNYVITITLKAFQTNITVFISVTVTLAFLKRKDPSRWSYSKINQFMITWSRGGRL